MAPNWNQFHSGVEMATLSIKGVPENWAAALRERAALNHRSLQGELMAIIEQAAAEASSQTRARDSVGIAGKGAAGSSDEAMKTMRSTRTGRKTIEQIAQEHRQRFPEPIRGGPLAVDIIREDRDSR
jgi:plasmid stability protein